MIAVRRVWTRFVQLAELVAVCKQWAVLLVVRASTAIQGLRRRRESEESVVLIHIGRGSRERVVEQHGETGDGEDRRSWHWL